jgi:NADH-quinone oxidoreductase subunit J
MSVTQFSFFILAALALVGGVGMVTLRNLVHSVLAMILSFLAVAGIFVLLEAGFLAVVQILIYVGALAILVLFAVMLTRDVLGRRLQVKAAQWPLALATSAALLVGLTVALMHVAWPAGAPAALSGDSVVELGKALVGPYALPFEAASVLLLAALIGAIVVAREARA